MKNNPNTKYVLIGLVALIWGLIIYKIIKGLNGDEIVVPVTTAKPIVKPIADSTYNLLTEEYQDPFTNNLALEEDTIIEQNTNVATTEPPMPTEFVQPAPQEPPPAIMYKGYIFNPITKKKTALITYNGQSMVVAVADRLDERTKIVKIEDAQLVVSFKGERIVIGIGG